MAQEKTMGSTIVADAFLEALAEVQPIPRVLLVDE